jgi:N-methylhydantoinase A
VYDIINNKMSDLIRRQIVKSGYLPEDFVLYAFGGAGPVHAVGFARALGIKEIYVFPTSPVFSAFGAAMADISHSRVMTYQAIMPVEPRVLNERLESVEGELMSQMAGENFTPEQVTFRRFVSMRFRRQTYGVELPLPWDRLTEERVVELQQLFVQKYEDLYGKGAGFVEAGTEINTLRVDAVGPVPKPVLTQEDSSGLSDSREARKGTRRASFNREFLDTDIYAYERLQPGPAISGPAIVEAPLTTVVVPPGYSAAMDTYRNLVLTEERAAGASTNGWTRSGNRT